MSKKPDLAKALQFYAESGLEEIISEKSQNYFLQKDKKKSAEKVPAGNIPERKISTAQNFLKPQFSTSDAISSLAKKSQQNPMNQNSAEKFQSLNEIVAQAKKLAAAAKNLSELRKAVENFDGCNLKKMATNTVFCDGNANSKVMVIGEAPGNHEDLQGIPFCGDSGKVLDDMFRAINLTRKENFYITNVIFWRPPGNRRPTEEELAICRPFVERHIQLVNPEVLVLVGATSMTAVLGITDPVSGVRGKFMDFSPKFLSRTIKTFTIFHPSYLMRQSSKKKIAWQDMLALESFLQPLFSFENHQSNDRRNRH
jgi:uracil-DNA glycosylase family 4